MEEEVVEVTQLTQIDNAKLKVKHFDTTIMLTYVILSIALLIGIYMAMSPGATSSDIASMTVFP
jgi:hypothetical protein